MAADLPVLGEVERSCLDRYVDLLVAKLGDRLLEISVFGSVARGESWPAGMPMRSNLDLLVLTTARSCSTTARGQARAASRRFRQ